jgi:hypothetical protein
VAVTAARPAALDTPKSVIFAVPSVASNTLSGLTSRCTTPFACASASAAAICAPIDATWAGGSPPRVAVTSARLSDLRYSMTRHGRPS